MFVYLYRLPQNLPIEKSSETPNETNSPQDSGGGNTVLTHSMTRTQAAAPETWSSWSCVVNAESSSALFTLQQNKPKLKREGGLFCFGFFTENTLVFVSRSTVGKSKMAVSSSRCSWTRAQLLRQPCRILSSSCWNRLCASFEDLTSLWIAELCCALLCCTALLCSALLGHAIRLERFVYTCSSGYPKQPPQSHPLIILQHLSSQLGQL